MKTDRLNRSPRPPQPMADANLATEVLSKLDAYAKKPMIRRAGVGYIVAKDPSTNRAIAVVDGDFGRAEFRAVVAELAQADVADGAFIVVANTATYSGQMIQFVKFEALGISRVKETSHVVVGSRGFDVDTLEAGHMASPKYKVLLTLRTSCGCVGQGVLGTDQPLSWNSEADGETVEATFSRVDVATLAIEEVVVINGDDWREFECTHAEAGLVANVSIGKSLAQALDGVPSGHPTDGDEASTPDPSASLMISLNGGLTYVPAEDGVRIIRKDVLVPGEDEPGELHLNVTTEGLISDLWVTRDERMDHNLGTSSEAFDDMVERFVDVAEHVDAPRPGM